MQYTDRALVAIPTFTQTSSAELDAALNHFREELFIPYGLATAQQKMIFRVKNADRLKEEPVTVPISDTENYTLRHINPLTRPTRKDAVDVLRKMRTPQDWQNLLPFLSGLRMAGRSFSTRRWQWLVRKAMKDDTLGILLECAKQPSVTNMRLSDAEFVKYLFMGLHEKAQRGKYQDPAVSKAFTLAKQFVSLMEAPEHHPHDTKQDPKKLPEVIGVLLELSAARALNVNGGKDETGDVRAYASRLLGSWQAGNFAIDNYRWPAIDRRLLENLPIYNGMKFALQVHGVSNDKSIAPGLKTRINELGMIISNQKKLAPKEVREQPTVGLKMSLLLHKD